MFAYVAAALPRQDCPYLVEAAEQTPLVGLDDEFNHEMDIILDRLQVEECACGARVAGGHARTARATGQVRQSAPMRRSSLSST